MGQTVRQLTVMDASYLYLETAEVPMHVGSLSIFRLPETNRGDFFEGLKALIGRRLHLAPMLAWKLASTPLDIHRPSWIEDDQFDIDRHVFRGALPAPADLPTLQRQVGWLHAMPLNRARPLWEIYVFDGLPDRQVAVYSKMHHACIDCGAGAAMVQLIYELSPTPKSSSKGDKNRKPSRKSEDVSFLSSLVTSSLEFWKLDGRSTARTPIDLPRTGKTDLGSVLVDALVQGVQQTHRIATSLPDILKVVGDIGGKLTTPGSLEDLQKFAAPQTPLNGMVTSERSFATASLSLTRIRAVAKASGVKLNDVILAICSGALRDHLKKTGDLPKRSLTSFVPVSTRMEGDKSASNQVIGMICPLFTEVADPKKRLELIEGHALKAKEVTSPLKQFMPLVTDAVTLGSPVGMRVASLLFSRLKLADLLPPPANVVISNVIGPETTLFANGAELLHAFPVSVVGHTFGLNITLQSYRDNVDFGLIAASNVLPDPQPMANSLEKQLIDLEAAYGIG